MAPSPTWPILGISAGVLLASATWFAGTAVAPALQEAWQLDASGAALLTSSTQLGFLLGTLLFAALNLADRFGAREVFLASALAGAACNAGFALGTDDIAGAAALRLLTGVSLAGVYPVGMKLVASWSRRGLGLWLGVLVGALTAGTALPYLARWIGVDAPWRAVALSASAAAVAGGLLVRFAVPEGPHLRTRASFDLHAAWRVFARPAFRWNALGYFGHMWELYAFWALLPMWLGEAPAHALPAWAVAGLAFAVVAVGAPGCVLGGLLSRRLGERRVALLALSVSAASCLLSPWLAALPTAFLVAALAVWGMAVVADSPQFSAIAARTCPPAYTATALTVQNGIGFAVTVVSIQVTALLGEVAGARTAFAALAIGPLLGGVAMLRLAAADVSSEAEG